jgi:hypothetical protein
MVCDYCVSQALGIKIYYSLACCQHYARNNSKGGHRECVVDASHGQNQGWNAFGHTKTLQSQPQQSWHYNCWGHCRFDGPKFDINLYFINMRRIIT